MRGPSFSLYQATNHRPIWEIVWLVAVFALFGLYTIQVHAEIYRSVDQEGHVHYSDRPGEHTTEIKVPAAPTGENAVTDITREKRQKLLDIYRQDREKKKARLKVEREKRKKRAMNCAEIRKKLEGIQQAFFLHEKTADPYNPRIFTAEERRQTERRLQQQEQQWCD